MEPFSNVIGAMKNLTRNPLGSIALFIALIYGVAALLLGVSASTLSPSERLPLILFLVIFPLIVLIAFYCLVANHHKKLYAPTDFKDDKSFLQTLSPEVKQARIQEEIDSTESIVEKKSAPLAPSTPLRDDPTIRNLRIDREKMFARYVEAERLALAKIEADLGKKVHKEVSLGGGRETAFDGVVVDRNVITAIEVKFAPISFIPTSSIRETIYRAIIARDRIKRDGGPSEIRLIFVYVTSETNEERNRLVRQKVEQAIADAPIPVEFKFYELDDLKKRFQ